MKTVRKKTGASRVKSKSGTGSTAVRKKITRGGLRVGAGRPQGAKNKKNNLQKSIDFGVDIPYNNIINIIDKCKEGRVRNFKCGNLEIVFSSPEENNQENIQSKSADTELSEKNYHDNNLLEDSRIAQMLIDDPASFEQEIVDSHIRRFYAQVEN